MDYPVPGIWTKNFLSLVGLGYEFREVVGLSSVSMCWVASCWKSVRLGHSSEATLINWDNSCGVWEVWLGWFWSEVSDGGYIGGVWNCSSELCLETTGTWSSHAAILFDSDRANFGGEMFEICDVVGTLEFFSMSTSVLIGGGLWQSVGELICDMDHEAPISS